MWRPDGPMHETAWWSSWQGAVIIGLLLLIAGLLIWLIARSRAVPPGTSDAASRAASGARDDEAVELARMRYARGELDRDGFVRIIGDLTGEPPATVPPAPNASDPGTQAPTAEPPESPTTEPA